jgi:flagellar hook-associated protein 3 FlgL
MRVTASENYRNLIANLTLLNEKLGAANEQLSTGRKLVHLNDSPSGSAEIVKLNAQLADIDQYRTNADRTTMFLQVADSALSSVQNLIASIFTSASAAATNVNDINAREAITRQVRDLRDQILSVANSTVQGRYVFGGSQVTSVPFEISGDTVTYNGDSEVNKISIDDGLQAQVNVPGADIFLPVFDRISSLLTALDANDVDGIKAALNQYSSFQTGLTLARGQIGNSLGKVENIKAALDSAETTTRSEQSRLGDADMAKTITQMTQIQTALNATLSAAQITSQQKNLFDFLG